MHKQLGGKLSPEDLASYSRSPQWRNGAFQNEEVTAAAPPMRKMPGIILKMLRGNKAPRPAMPLPIAPFDASSFLEDAPRAKFIWYGHSALMIRVAGKTILSDPMLGPDTSPVGPFRTRRFSDDSLGVIDDFPEIDLVLLTHDHYDHLDLASILKLQQKVKQYFVALGVKRHLVSWGVSPELITEFDWWDESSFAGMQIHFTPGRHFSGRGLRDRAKCLWGGWVLETPSEKIWISGDSGYGAHFKTIGERFGSFDMAFLECGQYGEDWPLIHMFPGEAVQAALDANVRVAMPVHWAGFTLSYQHTWYEPVEAFGMLAKDKKLDFITPPLGTIFHAGSGLLDPWWNPYK